MLAIALLAWAGLASAQLPVPASSQFDITGFIQEAKLDGVGSGAHQGGHITVNGHVVTVPAETIVILPANSLTWQELFAQAPAPYTGVATGMAMADVPAPLTTYEAQVVGNRVGDQYIAGLIYISQHGLNSGAGFINFIDYGAGEMRVGGKVNVDANGVAVNTLDASNPGTRVRLNDPIVSGTTTGRYSLGLTPDRRFMVDQDNPTITAGTGFPMCLPRVAPPSVDPLCPQGNRLIDVTGNYVPSITMVDPATLQPGQLPDARIQVPFEVGDYVTFAGTLVTDAAQPTVGPWPANGVAGTYVSAHTITNNVAIYTAAGANPAYVMTNVALIGTGGLTVLGAGEAAIRTRFEGMTTDISRNIHLYGMDLDPVTGAVSDRDWGTIGVDPGPANGAVKGRWRFRPPCTASVATDKACTPPPAGTFLPPTREVRAVIEGTHGTPTLAANGILAGQYHAPILEYIFPENVPGTAVVPNNFEAIAFLACGGYASSTGVIVGQLSPWPGAAAPFCASAAQAPVANAGPAQTAAGGALVTLAGSATGTAPLTFAWTQSATDAVQVVLSGAGTPNPTFTAPFVATATVLNFTLTVTNSVGSSSASVAITVNGVQAPTVSYTPAAPLIVASGTPVTITATASDPQGLQVSYAWTQTAGAPVVLNPNPTTCALGSASCAISFTVTLPVGSVSSTTLIFSVTATNSAGLSSAAESTSVTINPPSDAIGITSAEYRTSKQRLVINATDSIVNPSVVLKLQPYLTVAGTIYNPDPAAGGVGNVFTNNGAGLYILDMVGAPRPACNPSDATLYASPCSLKPLDVKSNLGGDSLFFALTRIRQ